ncbi:hypothetical protein ACHHYP_01468 [Achlya hypogyna]|uniref:EF-hand domain-containing protein n=1 Tax=Achlya hypogyna TaxID=1202772 RepID=A0A1V9Z8Q2_ACHHY|nr:hypothetical protein ACHHYP_01468 [Achlya hypogyna]
MASPTKSKPPEKEPEKPKLVQPSAPTLDVETHPLLANLKLDGKETGAYMLCKFADDVLGHRARQIFREKASSIKGENGIYYYLKDLFRTFSMDDVVPSSAKSKSMLALMAPKPPPRTAADIVLEEHQFRKLMASDPAFECLVAQEDTSILFQRILNSATRTQVALLDFLEFCLLDRVQLLVLLCKYWHSLRKLKLSDNELLEIYRRMTDVHTDSQLAPALFGNAIGREFDVVLTTGEIDVLLQMLDYDNDGVVKPVDFEAFYKDADRFQSPTFEELPAISDLRFSTSDEEAAEFKREGYTIYPRNVWTSHSKGHLFLWCKRDATKVPIEAIAYSAFNNDKDLMGRGYVCLNGAKPFYKKYLYLKFASAKPMTGLQAPAIVDICITTGTTHSRHLVDDQSATLWMPPCRGFKRIGGSLDEKVAKRGVFLWTRAVYPVSDVVATPSVLSPTATPGPVIPIAEIDALEQQIRNTVRRRCPTDADGVLNFLKLFQAFDVKSRKYLTIAKVRQGLMGLGCRLDPKRFQEVWKRIDAHSVKKIDYDALLVFVLWTDTEIDAVAETLQRSLTSASSNYRVVFTSHNAIGDGKWARGDFLRLLAAQQILVAPEELAKIMQRFDVNKDGIVDYADFLKFVTGVCDIQARQAARIAHAASVLQGWAIEHQNVKLAKDGHIDSTTSWKKIRSPGDVLRTPMIDKVLRQHKVRLTPTELRQLCVVISPNPPPTVEPGQISSAAYHAFVNHNPKKIGSLLLAGRKLVGPHPSGDVDPVYNRLNSLGTGSATLAALHNHIMELAAEHSVPSIDIKDFVYLVQHTGADCGGDGRVVIDRFLAALRDVAERRNMKHGFVTPYDSPGFAKGCYMLLGEIKRCAKTLDGKFDYSVPFGLFDADQTGSISLPQFEATLRDMDVGQFMTGNELKSLLRRFELDNRGGIGYDEFCRFATTSDEGHHLLSHWNDPKLVACMKEAFAATLPATGAETFAGVFKRMCLIADKDNTGVLSATKLERLFDALDLQLPRKSKKDRPYLIEALAHHANSEDAIPYDTFCQVYLACMAPQCREDGKPAAVNPALALELFSELQKAEAKSGQRYDFKAACENYGNKLSGNDFKEMLWTAGLRYPFSPDEIAELHRYFVAPATQLWDSSAFLDFCVRGLKVFESGESRGKVDAVIAQMQQHILDVVANEKDADRFHRLFLEYDGNQDGSISTDEFLLVLEEMGLSKGLTAAEKESILRFFDSNQDGEIDYLEFFHFATNADKILQTKVDPTKAAPPPAEQPKASAEKLVSSPAKSPAKAPQSPSKDQMQALQSQGNFTRLGKQMVRLALLDQQLPRPFVFAKYFVKYKAGDHGVAASKFTQILDKFLDTVLRGNRHASVAAVDVGVVRDHYLVHETGLVKTPLFLRDLATAQLLALDPKSAASVREDAGDDDDELSLSGSSSSSSDSSSDNASCRRSSRGKKPALGAVLDRILQTAGWSPSKCAKCEAKLQDVAGHGLWRPKAFSQWLLQLKLPLKKSDIDAILAACKAKHHRVDAGPFLHEMAAALDRFTGGSPRKAAGSPALPELMGRLYQGFLAAAQRNVNGLQLLEKCDVHRRGHISWAEFATVLRLLECSLEPAELSLLQAALQSSTTCPYRAFATLLETYAPPSAAVTYSEPPATLFARPEPPRLSPRPPVATPLRALPPSPASLARIERELSRLFDDARVDRARFVASCQQYDGQRSGFVTLDGFFAVLRQLRVAAGQELAAPVAARFAATFSDSIDYVDLASVVFRDARPPRSPTRPCLESAATHGLRREDAPVLTARTVETWLKEAATEDEKAHFTQMYNSIFAFKKHAAPVAPTPRRAAATSAAQWSCPVCFHSQSTSVEACEVCAAKNVVHANTSDFEVVLQCSVCAFRNKSTATTCALCLTPLHCTEKASTAPSKTPALHITSANDGWLT